MAQRNGMILIISGPSGSGKSTLCKKRFAEFPSMEFSVSCTTRSPRGEEKDGVDYHFLDKKAFEEHIAKGDFLEYALVHGNYYGTLKSEVLDRTDRGIDVVLDIDVQGAMILKEKFAADPVIGPRLEMLFVAPPSYTELEKRLRGRGTDAEESIVKRLANAKGEMAYWKAYTYIVINNDLEEACGNLSRIIHALHQKSIRYKEVPFHEC